jgi:malonate decarboxylase delta subunit
MEQFHFDLAVARDAAGARKMALVGVVASGNLEVLVQRGADPGRCQIEVNTAARGFRDLWEAVVADFAQRRAAGGLRIAINDGGARPDTVSLRLAQAIRQIEEPDA